MTGVYIGHMHIFIQVGTQEQELVSKYHMNGSTCLHFSPFQKRRTNKIKAIKKQCDISIDFTVIVLIWKRKGYYVHIINCFNNILDFFTIYKNMHLLFGLFHNFDPSAQNFLSASDENSRMFFMSSYIGTRMFKFICF